MFQQIYNEQAAERRRIEAERLEEEKIEAMIKEKERRRMKEMELEREFEEERKKARAEEVGIHKYRLKLFFAENLLGPVVNCKRSLAVARHVRRKMIFNQ